MSTSFNPRPSQARILDYSGGRLGIAAVPGAGKTHILSALAAQIIQSGALGEGQEVLIVTLVNSAVDNFEARVKGFFENPLRALYRYRVRTLHALAHEIVREKPGRVGLEEGFIILDEHETDSIRRDAVQGLLAANPGVAAGFLNPDLEDRSLDRVRRQYLPELLQSLALAFIRSAKDRRLTPEQIRALLEQSPGELPLAELGLAIYTDYQRALAYRGAVDFDDLIRLALDLLEDDTEYLERLHYRFPFVLEDEAQDSSISQEKILALLSGPAGNWVRVGDPNQAIFETFTTASPDLLREFIRANPHVDMDESGRSQPSIITLANQLIAWSMNEHPVLATRTALGPPYIRPVPENDSQPNPPDDPPAVRFIDAKFTPNEEVEAVVKSVKSYLDSMIDEPDEEKPTIAILVPRNRRGSEVIDALRKRGIEPVELIASTSETRAAAGSLNYLLAYLSEPQSASRLARAYQVWRRDWRSPRDKRIEEDETGSLSIGEDGPGRLKRELLAKVPTLLRKLVGVEDFIAPSGGRDWRELLPEGVPELVLEELALFRPRIRRWLEAVSLPIDQLVLTLGQEIFSSPSDLALGHKLALALRQAADDHSDWRLPELSAELAIIARNERRFLGFSSDDSGFDPWRHKGQVVVATMHKAKGLEWDRVYLMSVNNYDFPANEPNDNYIAEKWFIRGRLNLEAEALAQLAVLQSTDEFAWYTEGQATERARLDYVKERLRLFYVGITRARRDLIMTWNSGRRGEATPALAFAALSGSLLGD